MVPFLREGAHSRAIASLDCKGAMRAIAPSMSQHVSPQHGPTPIFCAATAGGLTIVQTQKSRLHAPSVPMRSAPAYFFFQMGPKTRAPQVLSDHF
jgi:hypothetical protein